MICEEWCLRRMVSEDGCVNSGDRAEIDLRDETDSQADTDFMRELFCSLPQNRALLEIDEFLVEIQLRSREQQYRAQYPDASFQLILLEGRLVGRLASSRVGDPWAMIDIALLPESQSRGIGTRLVRDLINDATDEGCDVCASVAAGNVRAQSLWLRLGFEVIQKRRDYWSLRCRCGTNKS